MARTVQEIKAKIRSLSAADRDRLLRELVADLDQETDQEIEAAWLEEAQKRHQELRSGAVKAVPASVVMRRVRARLKHEG